MTLRIAVTPGEPAGIGPDLLLQLIQDGHPHELVAYTDPDMLRRRAELLGLPLRLRFPSDSPAPLARGELAVASAPVPAPIEPGRPSLGTAAWVLDTVRAAVADCLPGRCAALVTGPIHKAIINDAGIPFSGHTELLAELTGTTQVVMMLATADLRVALATTHLPLAEVPRAITRERLTRVIEVLHADLVDRFAIPAPRILVCGLNPHAGEGGHLGREEIEVLTPVLDELRAHGMDLVGPLPADTLFTPHHLATADAVLAMYHDQGLPVLKHSGFGRAVNITLGLPLIRTSVDHGTALELVGTGTADSSSFRAAIDCAADLALRRRR